MNPVPPAFGRCVLDASVAAKWLVWAGEPLEREAIDLLTRRNAGLIEMLVPDLFWAEVGNILWKARQRGRCSPSEAGNSLAELQTYHLPTISTQDLLHDALEIALKHNRSFYDSIYLALAVKEHATLITADERLANSVAAYLPVRWLGSI